MRSEKFASRYAPFCVLAAIFATGFAALAVRLREEQIDHAAKHRRDMQSQSFRLVQTSGLRGRILDRRGVPLAHDRLSLCIAVNPEAYRARTKREKTEDRLMEALSAAAATVGRPPSVGRDAVRAHLRRELAQPLVAWRDVTDAELARFSEHERELPGFECVAAAERVYPQGRLAAHVLGRVGRDRFLADQGDERMNFVEKELCGRDGVEYQYDEYLRGMPGRDRVVVDARGFACSRETVLEPHDGPDLSLTLDVSLQRAAEAQLEGLCGACVVLDPLTGAVRAMASSPAFDPNDCVPVFRAETYERYAKDPAKPLLNRATAGTYAPGSTYKTMTALAGLAAGHPASEVRYCTGAFELGGMRIGCSRTWGHGPLDLVHALRDSCNPYFCALGVAAGTNALVTVSRAFGLGARTGIDFPADAAGVVPDAAYKERTSGGARWRLGDLAQMSIGQGQLLVTPLQMARLAAALGTGRLATPRLNADLPARTEPVPVPAAHLAAVREGMRLVVDGGTGRLAGEGVAARVIGKTGTAQVGLGERKRKNVWFIAYATPTEASASREPLALAIVVENGESGGSTAAPKAAAILRSFYNRGEEAGG